MDLSRHEGFTYVPEVVSVLDSSKNQAAHYLQIVLGYEIELRFNEQWTAVCPHFGIETQFPHDKPNAICSRLEKWITEHILYVICPLPIIFDLALHHNITLAEAQVIFDERASR